MARGQPKKVKITDDNAAQTVGAQAPPSSHTGTHIQPLAEGAGNTMASEVPIDLQLKSLKAAYREAIGAVPKKSKKGKNKKKENSQQELEDAHLTESNGPFRVNGQENTKGEKKVEGAEDHPGPAQITRQAKLAEVAEQPAQPVGRTTRRQAKAQEGPYEDLLPEALDEQIGASDIGRARDSDFLMSLIAGRSTVNPRSINNSLSGRSIRSARAANDHLLLAEEALRKASREPTNSKVTETQFQEVTAMLQTEPKELKSTVKDQQINESSTQQAAKPVRRQEYVDCNDDSFVEQITSRSPAKPFSGAKVSLEIRKSLVSQSPSKSAVASLKDRTSSQVSDEEQDSFVEHISSRSPAKQASRIEDSVEALDQMEEVEEALHEAAMAERLVSPEKKRQKKEQLAKQPTVVGAQAAPIPKTTKQQPVKTGFQSMRVKAAPKQASIIKKATSMIFKPSESSETSSILEEANKSDQTKKSVPVKRPTSLLPPKELVKSKKPSTRPTNFELPGEAVARKLKEQREQRLAQRESREDSFFTARTYPGPTVKSTKPLTKPDFELPGEALSRKKREVHEAKLKAQEEEEQKRREFKAKPVRKSVIRDTIASRARQSRFGLEGMEDGDLSVSKRNSMNVGAHRPSILELATMVANTSAPRSPGPPIALERRPSTKFHGPSRSGLAMQRTVSATEVQIQRQRAKEIYNRDQKLAEDIEREKRDREAAAKRSREEAAERGRQASREWAERQRAKKLAGGDKGMSAGYGPGGQMGLGA